MTLKKLAKFNRLLGIAFAFGTAATHGDQTAAEVTKMLSKPLPEPVRTSSTVKARRSVIDSSGITRRTVTRQANVSTLNRDVERSSQLMAPLARASSRKGAKSDEALAATINRWNGNRGSDDFSIWEDFIRDNPDSAWTPSVGLNLGHFYYQTGYFEKALNAWFQVWEGTSDSEGPEATKIRNHAIAQYAVMLARVGRMDDLQHLLDSLGNRIFQGDALIQLNRARTGLWKMKNRPEISFKCGPYALNRIYRDIRGEETEGFLATVRSTKEGFSLAAIEEMAESQLGMPMQMAKRRAGANVIVPSVVHWKLDHYGAITKEENGYYLIEDPTFGNETWVSKKALDEEGSGYYLIPEGNLPEGWATVQSEEGSTIYGKGHSGDSDEDETSDCSKKEGGCGGSGHKMAVYSFHLMLASLNVFDIPVGYQPARGPSVYFKVSYNMKEAGQPSVMNYTNFSPQWENQWVSYLEDNPSNPAANVKVSLPSGGAEVHRGFNSGTQSFGKNRRYDNVLKRVASGHYEKKESDGSRYVYSHAIGSTGPARKVFLTQIIDPQNNAVTLVYDTTPGFETRLIEIVDATGLSTILKYDEPGYPYLVTEVEDPFGRKATFTYQQVQGENRLVTITDVIGIQSSFNYNVNGQIVALTTPYGTTSFTFDNPNVSYGLIRWIEATDPKGNKERVEYNLGAHLTGMPGSAPAIQVPTVSGFSFATGDFDDRNTFYWDKKAMRHAAGDYTKAHLYHWLQVDGADFASGVLEAEKPAYENRVWYRYPGQPSAMDIGSSAQPTVIARKVEDGAGGETTEVSFREYNALGNVTKTIDPLGRETQFVYDTNEIDVLEVKQKIGGVMQTVKSYAYDPLYPSHRPKTITDAAGQTTTYTYNGAGQVLTIKNALNETTTYTYETNPSANGYGKVLQIEGAVTGSTQTFTYDAYHRVRTVTTSDGYSLTFDYDVFDRITLITYPDSTTEQFVYDRLDLRSKKDRLQRVTHTLHNELRQPILEVDPEGRKTLYEWCKCGALQGLTDGEGSRTRWTYDEQARLRKKTYADGSMIHYNYAPLSGRLISITDAKGQVQNLSYYLDGSTKSVSYTNLAPGTEETPPVTYSYDPDISRLVTMQDGIGTTSYTYHPVGSLGALQKATENGPLSGSSDLLTYSYDALGRLKTRNIGASGTEDKITYTYDALGRVSTVENALGVINTSYEGHTNRPLQILLPGDQKIGYFYQNNVNDHRLETIHYLANMNDPNSTVSRFDYSYKADGQIATWRRQFGSAPATEYSFGYDAINQIRDATLVEVGTPSNVLKRHSYRYDKAGNRLSEQNGNVVSSAIYNNVNQLTSTGGGGQLLVEGRTDKPAKVEINNVPTATQLDNSYSAWVNVVAGPNTITVKAEDYTPNLNRAVKEWTVDVLDGQAGTLTYDGDGNLLSDGARAFTWDAKNQLKSVTINGDTYYWEYDGQGRRIKEKMNNALQRQWIWDGLEIVQERDDGDALTKQFYAYGVKRGDDVYFYSRDHLGSIREVVNMDGNVMVRYDYEIWGKRVKLFGDIDSDFGFTGHYEHSESELTMAPFRVYNSEVARWISRDPIKESGGLNLYAYVNNSPSSLVDRFGWYPTVVTCGGVELINRTKHELNRPFVIRNEGSPAYPGDPSSRYQHCVVSCRISAEAIGGRFTAWLGGDVMQDPFWQEGGFNDDSDPGDRAANKVGRDLSKCKKVRKAKNKKKACEEGCADAAKDGKLWGTDAQGNPW